MRKNKKLSLIKSAKVFRSSYSRFKRKKSKLSPSQEKEIKEKLLTLKEALDSKDKEKASSLAHETLDLLDKYAPKSFIDRSFEFFSAIIFALFLAILIRQMWFEFYSIPSGSMRPTFKENDFLVVSKTDFGIDTPWRTGHFYFNDNLVKRGDIVVFSGEGMDIQGVETMYFYVLPGKKQFVKRIIGKPGDTLYFYGGQIYGIDKEGKPIEDFQKNTWFTQLEHIPFIKFEGKITTPPHPDGSVYSPIYLHQMNEVVAKLEYSAPSRLKGYMASYRDNPTFTPSSKIEDLTDLWGMGNFAMTRLLTKDEIHQLYKQTPSKDAPLYLELIHHPSIDHLKLAKDFYGRVRPTLNYSVSFLPVNEEHMKKLFSHIYTCRFRVKDQIAYSISTPKRALAYKSQFPRLESVEDGTYEFLDGKAYKVYLGGITKELPSSHPLLEISPDRLQKLFNLGIEFNNLFLPSSSKDLLPPRYGYFRDGSFYVLGHPIYTSSDPTLIEFISNEKTKPYPFLDKRSPMKNGSLDIDIIKKYGLTVPPESYLALGDNHAMSADSREFGFVPQENLRGRAGFIFWPFSSRMGSLPQPGYVFFTLPNIIIILIVLLCTVGYIIYLKKRRYHL